MDSTDFYVNGLLSFGSSLESALNIGSNSKTNRYRRKKRRRIGLISIVFITIIIVWLIAIILIFGRLDLEDELNSIDVPSYYVNKDEGQQKQAHNVRLPKYPIIHRTSSQPRQLTDQAILQCHKALWHTVGTTVSVLPNNETFVITGDIKNLLLRDSAAQIHPLLLPNTYNGKSLVQLDAKLERVVSGLILKTARYIRFDPYANAFSLHVKKVSKRDREILGRHGYIATWNYELDSACYYMRMIYFFHANFPNHPILRMKEVQDAVKIMVDVWISEQRHEENAYPNGTLFDCVHCGKPYRYNPKELERNGKGTKTNSSAGLTWSGFRPSDDACVYGYIIPANMFAVVVLGYMEEIATLIWKDGILVKKAQKLRTEIDEGIQRYGIVEHKTYGRIYAYEVDGLGNSLLMDDANVPSLLSVPYLGYEYDEEVFANTKRFLFSKDNPFFHRGNSGGIEYSGIGSPHTHFIPSSIWPMAMIMEGLISNNVTEKVILVEKLIASSVGDGWMHESFNPNNPKRFSRPWFCWPDSLFAELFMSLTDACPRPQYGKYTVNEWLDTSATIINGSVFSNPGLEHSSLTVISACIPGKRFKDNYINASLSNKELFCNKWGVECVLAREGHDSRSAKWEKLYLLNRTLYNSTSDWLMWLDCDAVFTNLDIDWRHHLNGYLDKSNVLTVSKDKNGINLGVLFVPNTNASRQFISQMWEKRNYIEMHPNKKELKDQAALEKLQEEDPELNQSINDEVPQEKINSVSFLFTNKV